MFRLQKCLCCSLRMGTFVIGYLNISLIVIAIIGLIVGLSLNTNPDKQLKMGLIISVCVTTLVLLINVLMVCGVHKSNPGYLIAWLAIKFLGLLFYAVLIVVACVQSVSNEEEPVTYIMMFVLLPLTLVFACYLYLVVYSHYKELADGPRHGRLYDRATYEFSDTQVVMVAEK